MNKKGFWFVNVAVVSILLLTALAACAPQPTAEAPTAPPAAPTTAPATEAVQPTEAPPPGPTGTLRVAHSEKMEALDPQARLQIHSYNVALMIYDSLVDVDDEGNVLPRLATSWELVDENTWKFTLREGVKFHNGEPFTSESVKFTLDRVVNPDTKSPQASVWTSYDTVDTSDPYVALIKTKEPMGTMLTNLALTAMLPPEAGKTLDFATEAIGTGPFKFVEWKLDDHLTLEANEEYWGDVPKIKTVIIRDIPEATTRASALETGEVDFLWGVTPEERERLDSLPDISVIDYPTYTVRFLWLNAGREPFTKPEVRDAVRYALDLDAILETIFAGQGVRATGCIAKGVVGYCEQPPYAYDPEKAKELLVEAGYPDGFEAEVKVPTYLPKQKELAEVIAAYLGEIGIKVKVTIQDQALWIEDLMALNWDMNLLGTGTITGDADFTLRRIYQSSAKRTGFYSDELDQLLIGQQSVLDADERLDMLCQACNILWDDGPTIWLFQTSWLYGFRDNVKGFVPHYNEFIYFDKMYLEE